MPRPACRPNRWGWSVAVLPCLLAVLAAGCGGGGNDDGIKTYKVAYPDDSGKAHGQAAGPGHTPEPVPDGPPKTRLLGAIIPADQNSDYFLRFDGPIEKIDANEKDFDAFLNSIRVPGEGGKPISWTVPAGWSEAPARAMRVVTLHKTDNSAPDMYISTPLGGGLLGNVNRWRTDFVGIQAVTQDELKDVMKEIKLGDKTAYRVDFRGPGGKGGGMAPFMKGK
jgi:hypothetical protein